MVYGMWFVVSQRTNENRRIRLTSPSDFILLYLYLIIHNKFKSTTAIIDTETYHNKEQCQRPIRMMRKITYNVFRFFRYHFILKKRNKEKWEGAGMWKWVAGFHFAILSYLRTPWAKGIFRPKISSNIYKMHGKGWCKWPARG